MKKINSVNILIVTYNAEKYILKTLKSCLNQSYKNIEILVLDNASSDKTVEIIENLKSSKIKLFAGKKNLGPYKGLNFLLDHAKGKYIAIQDHDDIWFPEKLTKQVEFLENNKNINACGTRAYYFYEGRGILILDKKRKATNYVNHTSLLFHNQNFRYNTDILLADEYFEKIILGGNLTKIHCLKEALAIHRIRDDRRNLSRTRFLFDKKSLTEYLSINGLTLHSLVTLAGIFVAKYFPPFLEWFIITKIVKLKSEKISLAEFQESHPNILL